MDKVTTGQRFLPTPHISHTN